MVKITDIILKELLSFINLRAYHWKITYLYGVTIPPIEITYFEQKASEPNGYLFKGSELVDLAKGIYDLWDITLIGDKNLDKIAQIDDTNPEIYDFYIQFWDSSHWEIYSNNEEFLYKIETTFIIYSK